MGEATLRRAQDEASPLRGYVWAPLGRLLEAAEAPKWQVGAAGG